MNTAVVNRTRIPAKDRISRGKLILKGKSIVRGNLILRGKSIIRDRSSIPMNLRTNLPQVKVTQVTKPQGRITRTIERGGNGNIGIQGRNLVAKDGKIMRIKRNFTLNTVKKLDTAVGIGRKVLRSQNFRNIGRNMAAQNSNLSSRKVEFDDQDDILEGEADQGDFMGKANYSFANVSNFPRVPLLQTPLPLLPTPLALLPTPLLPLLPTPPVGDRVFPPVENFENYPQNEINMNNFRDNEIPKIVDYEAELRAKTVAYEEERRAFERERLALERERVEDMMYQEEQKRYEEEERKIDEERRYLDELRKTLDKEKRSLEILKKTVEQEEEMERSSMSTGREMINEHFGGFANNSNRMKQNSVRNAFQNQKPQNSRMPASGILEYIAKQNKNENRERVDGNSKRYEQNNPNPAPQRMPAAGLLDFMLNKNSTSGGRSGYPSNRGGGNSSTRGRGGKKNKNLNQSSKFSETERVYNTRASPIRSTRMGAASGLMNYLLDKNVRHDPSSNRGGSFNQSNNNNQNNFDDTMRGRDYNYSGSNNNPEYYSLNTPQRDLSRQNEIISNQNQNHNLNYGVHTQSGYQILSRGFKPVKEDIIYDQSQGNFSPYQKSFAGHPYYDNMYDQGRMDRNFSENSGKLGSFENQKAGNDSSFPSRFADNKFGFTGFPFGNRSPIYKGPQESERNYSSNQSFAGYSSQNTSQGERPTDSFYSYRPGDKQVNDTSKSGRSGVAGIDILGGSSSLMGAYYGNSSSSIGQNQGTSYGNSAFFGKEVRNNVNPSYSNSGHSKSAMNMKEEGSDSADNPLKRLRKKKKNLHRELRSLLPSQGLKKKRLESSLAELNAEISRLISQGQR